MKLSNEKYFIEFSVDRTFSLDSADNRHYDVVLNPEGLKKYNSIKPLLISCEKGETSISADIILVCDDLNMGESAVLEENTLTVLSENNIYRLDLDKREIFFSKQLDIEPWVSDIILHNNTYIIITETSVCCFDRDFSMLWEVQLHEHICDWKILENHIHIECDPASYMCWDENNCTEIEVTDKTRKIADIDCNGKVISEKYEPLSE